MARPTKHYGKWRIRWVDENGVRDIRMLRLSADRRRA